MTKLSKLKGLGPKSENRLNEIGIFTRSDLEQTGAIQAFIKLRNECTIKPSLNLLYAMVGALEDKHWNDIAKSERARLLIELDGYQDFELELKTDGIKVKI